MIVLDLKLDNFLAFKNFEMNMSYPKKIVRSYIPNEHLKNRPNFRYKKLNIIMGANASGKTSIGKMMMLIFNFMDTTQYERLVEAINDTSKDAKISIDFVTNDYYMYHVLIKVTPNELNKYQLDDINVQVKRVEIKEKDSYETCLAKIERIKDVGAGSVHEELKKIEGLTWMFTYPFDVAKNQIAVYKGKNKNLYVEILRILLKSFDPAIIGVEALETIDDAFVIRYEKKSVIIQDGKSIEPNILSSGTKGGIDIAAVLTDMIDGACNFYYCDEKFSYIHSDVERAILSIMIEKLEESGQLFFTTHNTDILDMPLPKHSYMFLKKDLSDKEMPIKCIDASSLLKRSTDNLKNAVENDLFSTAPNLELLFNLSKNK